MKLFDYLQPKKKNVSEPQVEEINYFLEKAGHGNFAAELKQLISVTPISFESYYWTVVEVVGYLFQLLPDTYHSENNQPYGLLAAACERTLLALRRRRSKLLPPGSDTETYYAQADHWTYAVFVGAMMRDLWKVYEFELSIPASNVHKEEYFEPLMYLNKQTYTNVLPKAVMGRDSNIHLMIYRLPHHAIQFLYRHINVWKDLMNFMHGKLSLLGEFIDSIGSNLSLNNVSINMEPLSPITEEIISYKIKFIEWFQQALKRQLPINSVDSGVYAVTEGIFIANEKIFERFIAEEKLPINLEQLKQELAQEKFLLANKTKNNRIHTYYKGEWIERNILTGYLIKLEDIFEAGKFPTIFDDLHREIN